MKLSFDLKLFSFLFLAFIGMTVIGTLSHELGHYTVAKCLGHEATIKYQSSPHWNQKIQAHLNEVYAQYKDEINQNKDFPDKEDYESTLKIYHSENVKVLLGGPLQTMFTGTLGLILLLVYKKKVIVDDKVTVTGWVLIFMALFWLRQIVNLFKAMMGLVLNGRPSMRGDEMRLTHYLDLPLWSIQLPTGLIGMGALAYIVFKILPLGTRFTFLLAGLLGGISGYYLWLIRFGAIVMP